MSRVNIKFSSEDVRSLYSDLVIATIGSVGFDLKAIISEKYTDAEVDILPGQRLGFPTGIFIEPVDPGVAAFVYSRSGLGAVNGLIVAQGVGVIDPDYRGEIIVYLLNTSQMCRSVKMGDRIAQLVFASYIKPVFTIVEELSETGRGSGGFGHTGR